MTRSLFLHIYRNIKFPGEERALLRGTGITIDCNLPVFLTKQAHTPSLLIPSFLLLLHFFFPSLDFYIQHNTHNIFLPVGFFCLKLSFLSHWLGYGKNQVAAWCLSLVRKVTQFAAQAARRVTKCYVQAMFEK